MKYWLARGFGRSDDKKLPSTPEENADLYCSFCGRNRREVAKLVAGPQVYICDNCIALCVGICDDEAPSGVCYAELVLANLAERPQHTPHVVVTPSRGLEPSA